MVVFIINVIIYYSSGGCFLGVFHGMIMGSDIGFVIDGIIAFLLIKQKLQGKYKQAKVT